MKITRYEVVAILLWVLGFICFLVSLQPSASLANDEPLFILMTVLLGMILLIISCLTLLSCVIFVPMAALLYFFEKGNKRQYHLNTKAFPELDGETQAYEDEVLANGFHYIGMYKAVHLHNKSDLRESCLYVDDSETIYAEIIRISDGHSIVTFISDYPDGFSYETLYKHPNVTEEKTDWLVVQTVKSSITAAYDYHSAHAELYNQAHGKPKKIREVSDAITSDEVKNEQVRSINLAYFRRFGVALIFALPLTVLAYCLNFLLPNVSLPIRLTAITFLLGLISFYGDTIQSKLLQNKSVDQRKPRKVAE